MRGREKMVWKVPSNSRHHLKELLKKIFISNSRSSGRCPIPQIISFLLVVYSNLQKWQFKAERKNSLFIPFRTGFFLTESDHRTYLWLSWTVGWLLHGDRYCTAEEFLTDGRSQNRRVTNKKKKKPSRIGKPFSKHTRRPGICCPQLMTEFDLSLALNGVTEWPPLP